MEGWWASITQASTLPITEGQTRLAGVAWRRAGALRAPQWPLQHPTPNKLPTRTLTTSHSSTRFL
ncbi:hypothetical protein E2C01_072187 [Portunus trituberculatus]|uniref:Uncharacterized protein n=1 Tax=Portunus trituberculatus TaxID=210409 RepID=A0A5B7I619_PORTR|nr:hypothetical protein [Portunus trituberculatus]